jgi:2,4-dienoyl-CoA reductase-like NADH-dependent reductase (Old Yellow Enzyme family)
MTQLFSPFHLPAPSGGINLANRMVVAPMCQYSAHDGLANDWHLTHWTNLMNSGAAALIIEATGVTPEGRITPRCLGLWNDACEVALTDHLKRARALTPKTTLVGIQLAHAGRKASSHIPSQSGASIPPTDPLGWQTLAPSNVPQLPHEHPPEALDQKGIDTIVKAFGVAAERAARAGVDFIELHGAHGYLLHQFLSPVANKRTDEYGGSLENRMRFPLAVMAAVRAAYDGVIGMRVSATDWVEGGFVPEEAVIFANRLKESQISYMHVSSGGVASGQKIPVGPGYQLPFAKLIKEQTGIPTIAVGMITDPHQAEKVLEDGQADLVAFARAFLYKPRWGWEAAAVLSGQVEAVEQYWRCLPREHQHVFKEIKIGGR